jgi:predicted unusual protein kinase regulating ubiquinone biosynthesis (AarF/ABC1/UbiB family)
MLAARALVGRSLRQQAAGRLPLGVAAAVASRLVPRGITATARSPFVVARSHRVATAATRQRFSTGATPETPPAAPLSATSAAAAAAATAAAAAATAVSSTAAATAAVAAAQKAAAAATAALAAARRSSALFRNLFLATVPATALGGYGYFYWYTQGRQEVKFQKAVIDPHLRRKLDDLKPAATAMHPYSSSSWFWKLLFVIARTLQLVWIWLPVIVVAPLNALTGDQPAMRRLLIRLLVWTTKRAGCSFVKFGQWVSMRPDIFPADIIAAMKHLMTDAPAHSYAETRRIIRESFGLSIEDLFESFDEMPVASGSVAQVHRATLRPHQSPSGEAIEVAVKVLHPSTLDQTFIDIQIITWVMKRLPVLTAPMSGRDMARNISRQTDCRWEAYNLSQFQCNFFAEIAAGSIRVPQVVTGLVRPAVLVETWDHGRLITNAFGDDHVDTGGAGGAAAKAKMAAEAGGESQAGASGAAATAAVSSGGGGVGVGSAAHDGGPAVNRELRQRLAKRLFDTSLKMFLRDNFIHADLHAGNIMFSTPRGRGDASGSSGSGLGVSAGGMSSGSESLTLLDAGLTAQLDEPMRPVFSRFLIAMCRLEAQTISECLITFNLKQEPRPRTHAEMQRLEGMVQGVIDANATEDGRSTEDGGPVNVGCAAHARTPSTHTKHARVSRSRGTWIQPQQACLASLRSEVVLCCCPPLACGGGGVVQMRVCVCGGGGGGQTCAC